MAKLTWLGHGSWLIEAGEHRIVLDPFLDENPAATIKAAELEAGFVLVSHGHFDHVADAASIANRCNAQLIATYEISEWFAQNHDVKQTIGMNLGGGVDLPFGRVTMTTALHSSQLPDGSYGGNPGGFLLDLPEGRVYFACDTALFSDMKLIGDKGIDVAVLPIGDHFTMGPDDSVLATQFIRPKTVLPAHYNTWPPIEQDPQKWASCISDNTDATPVVLNVGESFEMA